MFYLRSIKEDGSVVNTQLGESYTKYDLFKMTNNCDLADGLRCEAITPDDLGESSISVMAGTNEYVIDPESTNYIVDSTGNTYERLYAKKMTHKMWNNLFESWELSCRFNV